MRHQPVLNRQQILAGLNDTLDILEKQWGQNPPDSLRLLRKHCLSAVSLSPQTFFSELKNMRTQCNHLNTLCHQGSPLQMRGQDIWSINWFSFAMSGRCCLAGYLHPGTNRRCRLCASLPAQHLLV